MRTRNIIIGCGRLGSSIADSLSEQGESVIIIDSDPLSFERLSDIFSGSKVTADATDMDALEDAGIANAKDLIISTGDDNINLFLAHLGHIVYQVPNIYVRFDDPDKGELVQGMGIKAIYPFSLSKGRFHMLRRGNEK